MNGQIVALGNIFGDLAFNGGLSGRIAVKGQTVLGLDPNRYGILGKITINGGIGSTAAIVSAGVIGDDGVYIGTTDSDANGTQITVNGNDSGILAAENDINFSKAIKSNPGLFENATGANKLAIEAIFASPTLDSAGLNLILANLAKLHVGADGNLTIT
jgi:hypothetical protein